MPKARRFLAVVVVAFLIVLALQLKVLNSHARDANDIQPPRSRSRDAAATIVLPQHAEESSPPPSLPSRIGVSDEAGIDLDTRYPAETEFWAHPGNAAPPWLAALRYEMVLSQASTNYLFLVSEG